MDADDRGPANALNAIMLISGGKLLPLARKANSTWEKKPSDNESVLQYPLRESDQTRDNNITLTEV